MSVDPLELYLAQQLFYFQVLSTYMFLFLIRNEQVFFKLLLAVESHYFNDLIVNFMDVNQQQNVVW